MDLSINFQLNKIFNNTDNNSSKKDTLKVQEFLKCYYYYLFI